MFPELVPLCQISRRLLLYRWISRLSNVSRRDSSFMYATVRTSPERASCITHGTIPRSSNWTFAASLAVWTTIARLYEPPARAPEGAASALLDAEPIEQALVLPPALPHPHLQVEEDPRPELALELHAGGGSDLLDLAAARADQDPLL